MFPNYFRKVAVEQQRKESSWVDPLIIFRTTMVYISDPFQVVETLV